MRDMPGLPHNVLLRWLYSIFEINLSPFFSWTHDQCYLPKRQCWPRTGGFFNAYVVFQLIVLTLNMALPILSRAAKGLVLVAFVMLSVYCVLMPDMFHLRYSLVWMIVLVSLNLALLHYVWCSKKMAWVQGIPVICLAWFVVVAGLTPGNQVIPDLKKSNHRAFVQYAALRYDRLLKAQEDTWFNKICFTNSKTYPFYMAQYFHPEISEPYQVQVKNCSPTSFKFTGVKAFKLWLKSVEGQLY
jgi:hypothetical protein